MTNAHVVQGARTVEVRLSGSHRHFPTRAVRDPVLKYCTALSDGTHIDATVENFDVLADVAILRPSTKKKLTPVVVGKSSELRVGEWVIVCGSPGTIPSCPLRYCMLPPARPAMLLDAEPCVHCGFISTLLHSRFKMCLTGGLHVFDFEKYARFSSGLCLCRGCQRARTAECRAGDGSAENELHPD